MVKEEVFNAMSYGVWVSGDNTSNVNIRHTLIYHEE